MNLKSIQGPLTGRELAYRTPHKHPTFPSSLVLPGCSGMTHTSRTFLAAEDATNRCGNRGITKKQIHLKYLLFLPLGVVLFEIVNTEH